MEFNVKLQTLRKQNGLTQEDLAAKLHVSRTAVSKWESGRGYPNLDSLKEIAKLFDVTVDELLSGEELLCAAKSEQKRKENRIRDRVVGCLDLCSALLLFLPLFAQRVGQEVEAVSLLALRSINGYVWLAYLVVTGAMVICGILTLALQKTTNEPWLRCKRIVPFVLNLLAMVFFVLGMHPYAAVFMAVKVLIFVKMR